MRYASVCSGVEAASLAWMPLGWEAVFFSEIEPFPCEVLRQRWPEVPNLGDMTKINGEEYYGAIDLLVGGTPCQGFSTAGKQGGLDDERSALCLAYCRLLETMRPRWFVWENVPGVFSTNGGDDFKAFIRKIDEIGYSCAWRVLDAQYVRVDGFSGAVPQRRRRVFVVGHLGTDWRYPAAVLFEPDCLHGNTPPRRSKGTGVARSLTASTGGASGKEQQHTFIGNAGEPLNAIGYDAYIESGQDFWKTGDISGPLRAEQGGTVSNIVCTPEVANCLQTTCDDYSRADGFNMVLQSQPICFRWAASPSQGLPINSSILVLNDQGGSIMNVEDKGIAATLRANTHGNEQIICYENPAQDSRLKKIEVAPVLTERAGTGGGNLPLVAGFKPGQGAAAHGIGYAEELAPTLSSEAGGNTTPAISMRNIIRRLTPLECERLMGFPDNWTKIPWKGKPEDNCPDSPRYKACGNSMCVNVMRWIGMRIQQVEQKQITEGEA